MLFKKHKYFLTQIILITFKSQKTKLDSILKYMYDFDLIFGSKYHKNTIF